jgi:hypothetical protein
MDDVSPTTDGRPPHVAARRRTWRSLAVRLLLTTSVVAALGLVLPASAPASCAGPQLTVDGLIDRVPGAGAIAPTTPGSPAQIFPGQHIVVAGLHFHDGCADSIETSGCSGPRVIDPESPARGVELVLVRGERSWTLGTADARDATTQYAIRWEVVVPTDVPSGPASLAANSAQVRVDVRR